MKSFKMSAPILQSCKKYLFHFAQEHPDFRLAELKSILGIFKIQTNVPKGEEFNPFLVLDLPSDDCVHQIVSRSMLIRSVYHLWAKGRDYSELNARLRLLSKDFLHEHKVSDKTFRYTVTTFNKKLSHKEKIKKIESLPQDILDFKGKIQLTNSDRDYHIVEYYGNQQGTPTEEPETIYFGQWIVDGQRDLIGDYHLKNRHFIANTSMDACLSMIMANMGKVQKNMLVFDPFVGSGSLLVSAAHFGGYVMGNDIDYQLLHAKAKPSRPNQKKRATDESIYSNLRQYGLENLYIDAIVGDSSKDDLWREQTMFDAIITDPPYGIREGAKKVGTDKDEIGPIGGQSGQHFPEKKDYHLTDIFKDLLNFAAKYLHQYGRLVYWFPVSRQEYTEDNIPTHPCLKLISNCEQILNQRVSRRLITMEKISDCPDADNQAEVKVDHFEDSTFREKYFNIQKNDPNIKSTSAKLLNDGLNMSEISNTDPDIKFTSPEQLNDNLKSLDISAGIDLIQGGKTSLGNKVTSTVNNT